VGYRPEIQMPSSADYLSDRLRFNLKHVPQKRRSHDDSEIDRMRVDELVEEIRIVERL
jgi:hypothetical protein